MRIRHRLILGFLGVVAFFALFGAYVNLIWQTVNTDMVMLDELFEKTAVHSLGELDAVLHIGQNLEISRRALHEYLLGNSGAEDELRDSLVEFDNHYIELVDLLAEETTTAPGAEKIAELAELQAIETQHEHFAADVEEIITLVENGRLPEAMQILESEIETEISPISQQLLLFEASTEQQTEEVTADFDNVIHNVENKIRQMQIVILIVLGIGIFAAFILGYFTSESISGPIEQLAEAATAVEKGTYETSSLSPITSRTDELGQFARIFEHMAQEVYIREQRLKAQVSALQIEIDHKKSTEQVTEITETEFFKDLQSKAKAMRKRKN